MERDFLPISVKMRVGWRTVTFRHPTIGSIALALDLAREAGIEWPDEVSMVGVIEMLALRCPDALRAVILDATNLSPRRVRRLSSGQVATLSHRMLNAFGGRRILKYMRMLGGKGGKSWDWFSDTLDRMAADYHWNLPEIVTLPITALPGLMVSAKQRNAAESLRLCQAAAYGAADKVGRSQIGRPLELLAAGPKDAPPYEADEITPEHPERFHRVVDCIERLRQWRQP